MTRIICKNMVVLILMLIAFGWVAGPSYAALNMSEVRYLFEKETGEKWGQSTSEKKKAFLNDVRGREELQEVVEYKGREEREKELERRNMESRMAEGVTLSDRRKDKAPFYVRKSFEKAKNKSWADASDKEKETFWKDYNKKQGKKKRVAERKAAKKKRAKAKLVREKTKKKRAAIQKKNARIKAQQKKAKARQKAKQLLKKKAAKAKKKIQKARAKR